ncbi:hypothetical protein SAMN04488030_0593 [Aliiroseovarius halocynthiae]|uniref:Uncharacterized protein n=1 Tax=Aliiroseovarius halocynthiae TaxID=985055 RepID=A0A545SUE8_9RHOB|nr:hypothetical protein [Aliiroseovarius halocynthiae]TQV68567.1 hypothetical protein FIL88_02990 [Aliiroseovarius halocynthiae]SMR70973.1 hypothetical protein SAMN04488030_0593 [Aliiroseovarius halocynthiae]
MKILTNTPELLVLDHKPWLISLAMMAGMLIFLGVGITAITQGEWVFGLMFGGIGGSVWGICFLVFTKRVQIIFDTHAGQIVKRTRSFFGYAQDVYPLSPLCGAELEETRRDGSSMYRPVLVMTGQPNLPVVSYYTNGSGPRRTTEAVNRWLETRSTPMQLDSDSSKP